MNNVITMCQMCRRTFRQENTDEEINKEAKETWNIDNPEELVLICDDCHTKFMSQFN